MDQKFFRIPFALNGNQTAIDDALQPDGTVSFDQGYTFDYERELGVDPQAKAIERQKMNSLLFQITEALQQYQTVGTPEWITAANNGGTAYSYSIGAAVRYRALITDPWQIYDSLVDSNNSTPGTDPNKWRLRSPFPAGAVVAFAQTAVPEGWLRCNGQTVSRTTYAILFAAIGTTYGAGDGSTTFRLPEIRGEFIRGLDEGRGVDPGRALGTAQAQETQDHKHATPIAGSETNLSIIKQSLWPHGNSAFASTARSVVGADAPTTSTMLTGPMSNLTGETRPRNIAFPFCIKY